MQSKKSLDDMYNIAISNSDFEKADKVRECYNAIGDDLEILEEIRSLHIVFKDGDDYFLRTGKSLYLITRKQYDKWVRWLGNDK